jgi:Tfp pilus assembly protein PilF
MKNVILTFLLLFITVCVSAQQPYSTNNQEAIKNYALANQSIDEHEFTEAIALLQKAIIADDKFVEAHALLGNTMHLTKNNKGAIAEYKKVIALNPNFSRAIYMKVADMEISEAQYAEAMSHLQKYLSLPNNADKDREYAQKLLKDCIFSIDALQHPGHSSPSIWAPILIRLPTSIRLYQPLMIRPSYLPGK